MCSLSGKVIFGLKTSLMFLCFSWCIDSGVLHGEIYVYTKIALFIYVVWCGE